MNFNALYLRSLKTRVTLITLAAFLIGIWSLAFYASRMLREDMQHSLSDQQFSTVSLLASQVNEELSERLRALEKIAGNLSKEILDNAAALQSHLGQRILLQGLFNGGIIALDAYGTAIADVPVSSGRIGVNYMDRDFVFFVLKEGTSMIGRPVMANTLLAPLLVMAVPICDVQGEVIGALMGITNLGMPNFLDKITENRYGKSGGYFLVAPQFRLIVAATDKSRVMEQFPAPGINPVLDQYLLGKEGSDVYVNPLGVEVLGSAKAIPVAGWFLGAILPTEEAFAPIRAMQTRVLLATVFMTLLVGSLSWWMLRQLLSPVLAAVKTLAILSDTDQPSHPLPVTSQDEIGELIAGFNRLLESLAQRKQALKVSEERYRLLFQNLTAGFSLHEIILNDEGIPCDYRFLEVNPAFEKLTGLKRDVIEGKTVRQIMPDTEPYWIETYGSVAETGASIHFENYSQELGKHYVVTAYAPEPGKFATIFLDITERKKIEEALQESEAKFRNFADQSLVGIYLIQDRLLKYVNPKFSQIFGLTVEQCLDRPFDQLVYPEDLNTVEENIRKRLSGEVKAINYQFRGRRDKSEVIHLEVFGSSTLYNGKPAAIGTLLDISERKRVEAELLHLNETLEERVAQEVEKNLKHERLLIHQNRLAAMGEMIGNIAHQWRQPLNALGLLLYNIKDAHRFNTLDAEYLELAVSDGLRMVQKMSTTISDFSNFFRPDKASSVFSVMKQIRDAIALVESSFANGNISIHVDAPQDLNLLGFPNEYSHVLLNLLSNAKEAIQSRNLALSGRVDIIVREQNGLGCVSVCDNGGGIAIDILDRIFDPYFSTKESGTGIGLYMSKMIIERNMKGSITARNIEGGVAFIVAAALAKDGPQT